MSQKSLGSWIIRLSRCPYALLAIVIFIVLGVSFIKRYREGDWFKTYLPSAHHLWVGQSIYHNGDGYIYPPFPSLFALPFAYLPGKLPHLAWYAVLVACFVFMVRWSWKLARGPSLQGKIPAPSAEHLAFIAALIPGATYASNSISHSQSDLFIGFAIIAGCMALLHGRSLLAATLYALAAAIKGPALIWFPYLIARRKPLAALWIVVVFICVNLLPNAVGRRHELLLGEWTHDYLLPHKTTGNVYPDVWFSESNQSLLGCINRWTTTRWAWEKTGNDDYRQRIPLDHPMAASTVRKITLGTYGLLLLILATTLGWWPKKLGATPGSMRPALEFGMVATLMLICSPMAAKAQWGILMLPGFCLARLCYHRRDPVLIFCFAAGWIGWLASQNFLTKNAVFVGLWYGAVLWNAVFWFLGCAYALSPLAPGSTGVKTPGRAEG